LAGNSNFGGKIEFFGEIRVLAENSSFVRIFQFGQIEFLVQIISLNLCPFTFTHVNELQFTGSKA
jgi:hypothetical protein